MPSLTSTEKAKLEHSLALAHRHLYGAMQLYQYRDDDSTVQDLTAVLELLFTLLDAEVRGGKQLRTRPRGAR